MVARILVLLLLAMPSWALVVTNNVTALDINAHPVVMQSGVPYRYTIFANDGVSPINLTSAPAPTVLWAITDTRDDVLVDVYTGEVVNAASGSVRFAVNPSTNLEFGVSYRATATVYRAGAVVAPIALDWVSLVEAHCRTCGASSGSSGGGAFTVHVDGASAGPFTGPGSTGTVSSTVGDTSKFLRGDGQWRSISTPVEVWSNGVSLGVFDALQFTTGFGLRVVSDGTDTLAQIYPTFSSGQGTSIPGTTQLAVFAYTGSTQTYVVASGMTQMLAKIWGAGIQVAGYDGGYTEVTFPVTPLETLYIVVGQGTARTNPLPGIRPFGGAGYLVQTNVGGALAYPGGSGSFIFRNSGGTQDLIACAGGAAYGSDGGGLTAQNSGTGSAAGQTNGGVASTKTTNTDGSYLLGGLSATNGGSAAGSGFYGGYGSHTNNIGAGAGSGTIQFGVGITVRSNYSFDDDYPGTPAGYAAAVGAGNAAQGGHGYILLKGFVAP